MTRSFFLVAFAVMGGSFALACSSSSSPPAPTGTSPDGSAPTSDAATGGGGGGGSDAGSGGDASAACGQPGDVGNSLGVGKYCVNFSDCSGTPSAHFCSNLGDPTTHFCTLICSVDAGTSCGEGASCQCGSQGCGCTPNTCK